MATKKQTKISKANKQVGWWHRIWRIVRNSVIIFFVISIVWVLIDWFTPVFVTPLMVMRSVESLVQGNMPKNSKEWVSIDNISPNIVQAVVTSEDNQFLLHHGFSFDAMTKAFEHNQKGKRIRGGSTISQQTAKNVFLFPQRSYVRKGLEAYFTVLMELTWSKKRIMEVYLNVIEMGDGIYGVEAASQEYFGIHASQLSRSQSAAIAACLPNPRRFNPGHPSGYILRRKAHIMSLMDKVGPVDFDKNAAPVKHSRKHRRK
ncbi:MAG: monofunctional biosynthetic peptidoglycan transglycosylase [Paludibacter sp.]